MQPLRAVNASETGTEVIFRALADCSMFSKIAFHQILADNFNYENTSIGKRNIKE